MAKKAKKAKIGIEEEIPPFSPGEVEAPEKTEEDEAVEEMGAIGVYAHQNCYFVAGTGIVVRMQKGPISESRGQNGITKEQLAAIFFHTQRREDIV